MSGLFHMQRVSPPGTHERPCISRPPHGSKCACTQHPQALVETLPAQALGVDVAKRLEILSVEEPPKRRSGVRVASVAELVDKLHNEAKVV